MNKIKYVQSSVDYVDKLGTDLTVVNAARVSFDKNHSVLDHTDEGLIKYLAAHNHWTPFGHAQLQIRVKAPIFVARQLVKHQIGLVWNEVSRRYVTDDPEFLSVENWRKAADNVKQGSSKELINSSHLADEDYAMIVHQSLTTYRALLEIHVCPEQARMVLPVCTMTTWYWTGSLAAWARVCNLREAPHAQYETTVVSKQINKIVRDHFPLCWKYLFKYQ